MRPVQSRSRRPQRCSSGEHRPWLRASGSSPLPSRERRTQRHHSVSLTSGRCAWPVSSSVWRAWHSSFPCSRGWTPSWKRLPSRTAAGNGRCCALPWSSREQPGPLRARTAPALGDLPVFEKSYPVERNHDHEKYKQQRIDHQIAGFITAFHVTHDDDGAAVLVAERDIIRSRGIRQDEEGSLDGERPIVGKCLEHGGSVDLQRIHVLR